MDAAVHRELLRGPEHGQQVLMLEENRRSELRNGGWRAIRRPVNDSEAIAHYVGAATTPRSIPAQNPLVSTENHSAILGYEVPDGYQEDPEHVAIRRILHALAWSIKDDEPADKYQKLMQYKFDTTLKLPNRTLRDNVEAVCYAIALLLGAPDPIALPTCDPKDMSEIITLALYETLDALHINKVKKGEEAINFFNAYIKDELLSVSS